MSIGYGLVYYDKVSTPSPSVAQSLTFPGNSWLRSSVRHDHGPLPRSNRLQNRPGLQRYLPSLLGYLNVLLRHASRSLPNDLRIAKIQYGQNTWRRCLLLGVYLHANRSRNKLAGTLRPTFLSWLRREHHTNELHVHYLLILYPEGTSFATELVVLGYRDIYNCWRSYELWIWSDQGWNVETLAVYLPLGWIPHVPLWVGLLCCPEFAHHGVVLDRRTRCCYGALEVWADGVRCTKFKRSQIREGFLDIKVWLVAIMMASAYTVNGAVSGFGPLIVTTFGYSALDAIIFQFPLGGICFIFILLTGFLSSNIPNIRLILLILCCLPVIAGCAIIWKSSWSHHAKAPVAGYAIIGFFGPVVSLVITIGMVNVAGQTKKCFMAATIFVAYCVGNIIGPQLIKSQTRARHYPELWLGLIIW